MSEPDSLITRQSRSTCQVDAGDRYRNRSGALLITPFSVGQIVAPQPSGRAAKHWREGAVSPACDGEAAPGGVGDDRFDDAGARMSVGSGAEGCGVSFDDTVGAFTVDDAHDDGARFRTGELGLHRDAEAAADAEGYSDNESVVGVVDAVAVGRVEDLEAGEGVGVKPGAVPWVEPVGDDVGRFTDAGEGHYGRQMGVGRWSCREDRRVQWGFVADVVETDPCQDAVVVTGKRGPTVPGTRAQV